MLKEIYSSKIKERKKLLLEMSNFFKNDWPKIEKKIPY